MGLLSLGADRLGVFRFAMVGLGVSCYVGGLYGAVSGAEGFVAPRYAPVRRDRHVVGVKGPFLVSEVAECYGAAGCGKGF